MSLSLIVLLIGFFYLLNFIPSSTQDKSTNTWLQDKYGLSDEEAFIYNIIPDEGKRERYLSEILRKKMS